jgi:hypothetical protein
MAFEDIDRLGAVRRLEDRVTLRLESVAREQPDHAIVVHDEDRPLDIGGGRVSHR